jgi:hypothetical protein
MIQEGEHERSRGATFLDSSNVTLVLNGFGGQVVSMLACGNPGLGFNTGRRRLDFFVAVKIFSMSFSEGNLNMCPQSKL